MGQGPRSSGPSQGSAQIGSLRHVPKYSNQLVDVSAEEVVSVVKTGNKALRFKSKTFWFKSVAGTRRI